VNDDDLRMENEGLRGKLTKAERDREKLRAQRDRMAEFIKSLGFDPRRFF
jgi:hypothetical protein